MLCVFVLRNTNNREIPDKADILKIADSRNHFRAWCTSLDKLYVRKYKFICRHGLRQCCLRGSRSRISKSQRHKNPQTVVTIVAPKQHIAYLTSSLPLATFFMKSSILRNVIFLLCANESNLSLGINKKSTTAEKEATDIQPKAFDWKGFKLANTKILPSIHVHHRL